MQANKPASSCCCYGIGIFLICFSFACVSTLVLLNLPTMEMASTQLSGSIGDEVLKLEYEDFLKRHGKLYGTQEEKVKRFKIFAENYRKIEEYNSQTTTHQLGINHMADMTDEEYKARLLKAPPTVPTPRRIRQRFVAGANTTNETIDWVKAGKVNRVKDQGMCGSCWIFAGVGAVESLHAIKTGEMVSLSEQQILNCATGPTVKGCNGGEISDAYNYINKTGATLEKDVPYKAYEEACTKAPIFLHIGDFDTVPASDPFQMMTKLHKQPLSIYVTAGNFVFRFFKGGVMTHGCPKGIEADHGVMLVGSGVRDGIPYWRVKNSWGPNWGENGYIYLKRNMQKGDVQECMVGSKAQFPNSL